MAAYIDLRDLFSDDELKNRTDIAVVIAANKLLVGTPSIAEQKWATHVFSSPRSEGAKALMSVLATNNTLTITQIQQAGDAALQTAVDIAVPSLVVAFTG